jgi:hypothetical protein
MNRFPPLQVEVTAPARGWPADYRFSIEHPQAGSSTAALTLNLKGFVVPEHDGVPVPGALLLRVAGVVLWRGEIKLPRPDLADSELAAQAQRMGLRCGFDVLLPSFLSVRDEPVVLAIEAAEPAGVDAQVVELAVLVLRGAAPPLLRHGPALLTVNSLGRSGSSLLCRLLAEHPAFMVPTLQGQFGEVFVAGHVARLVASLGSQGALSWVNRQQDEPDAAVLMPGYLSVDGADGHEDLQLQGVLLSRFEESGRALFDASLLALDAYMRARKPGAQWWVEKSWSSMSAPLLGLYGRCWRELILVRRPADFIQSQGRFLRKLAIPEHERLAHLKATPLKLRKFCAVTLDRQDMACVIRFEDLVADVARCLERLLVYLGVPAGDGYLDRMRGLALQDDAFHQRLQTLPEPGSVPASEPLLAIDPVSLGAEYSEFCRAFGYDPTGQLLVFDA